MKLSYLEVKSLLIAGVCFGINKNDFVKYVRCLSGRELSNIKRVKEFKKLNDFFKVF